MRLALFEPDQTAGGGFLVIDDEDTPSSTVRLRRHELEILKVLSDALEQDHDLPPEVRGWRRVGQIAEIIARQGGYACEKETISRYLHNIRTSVRKATSSDAIAWLEEERSYGLRLTVPIATTVLSE